MKDRIVFFILGALLATFAYFAGNMNKLDADIDKKGVYDFLSVSHLEIDSMQVADNVTITKSGIIIGDAETNSKSMIRIFVEEGVPHIILYNGDDKKTSSVVTLSAYPIIPLFQLVGEDRKLVYSRLVLISFVFIELGLTQ